MIEPNERAVVLQKEKEKKTKENKIKIHNIIFGIGKQTTKQINK